MCCEKTHDINTKNLLFYVEKIDYKINVDFSFLLMYTKFLNF